MKKIISFIVAILIAFGMIALAHAVVYEALAAILAVIFFITMPAFVSYIFVFLAVSFMVATFISMKWNNKAVRAFYIFSAGWTGFVIYFFFAAFAYGVLIMFVVSSVISTFVSVAWIGFSLLVVVLIIGIYGIFHANDIRVKKINVTIPSMPAVWKNRTAVWVSDIHLGHVRGEFFAKRVTDTILSLKPDIVFIGGDLYDGSKVDEVEIIEPLRALTASDGDEIGRKRVPLGVYFIMGNHEEFNTRATALYAKAIKGIGIKILDDEMVSIDGLQVIGVDHGRTEDRTRFASILEKIFATGHFDPNSPSILLKHEPRDIDIVDRAGISFQISGHTHQGQIFPVSLVTRLVFKGFDYGLKEYIDFGRDGSNREHIQVYTSSGVGTWGPPLRVGTTSEIVICTFL
jgi:predicted MPP superfamily phosphohydrolase